MPRLGILMLLLTLVGTRGLAESTRPRETSSGSTVTAVHPFTAPQVELVGRVTGADGAPVVGARVQVVQTAAVSDSDGNYQLMASAGGCTIEVSAAGYMPLTIHTHVKGDSVLNFQLGLPPVTTVTAQADVTRDPSSQIINTEDLRMADPGQPGAPVSVPGYPAETASGGIKAPQYFAPGVAGDHGEPIAQYIQIGDFLFPNNLPANAHGNGYADPNWLISRGIGNAQTDAGAFDVRHGNNAVNLAVAYNLRPRLEPFVQFSGDMRDYDFVTGWSPSKPGVGAWLGLEIAGGNGFLALPEHRHQYKVNGLRSFSLGHHQLTLFAAGYYGFSRIPGLVPIAVRVQGDTIDPRQADRTHTSVWVASDTWQISEHQQIQFSSFFRTYSLDLTSNFGNGLIRQSEFRTAAGGNASYRHQWNRAVSLDAGADIRRDAPRGAELSRLDSTGIFRPVTRNDFTIGDAATYVSLSGDPWRFLSYNVGIRRDQVDFGIIDELHMLNSYRTGLGVFSPRGTLAFHRSHLPTLALSFGDAFHTNDPRIGSGIGRGTPVALSRAYQAVLTQSVKGTDFRIVLARVSNSQELAKLDPDTGLQQNLGPSLERSLTVSLRRHFSLGSLQAMFARARAMDRISGEDVPEAPHLIWDVSAMSVRLPCHMQASVGLEYVGRKPLGNGFTAMHVREIHSSFSRSFGNGLFDGGVYWLLASGYTGQTLETLKLPDELGPTERIVGVRKPSYAGVTLTYHFRREHSK